MAYMNLISENICFMKFVPKGKLPFLENNSSIITGICLLGLLSHFILCFKLFLFSVAMVERCGVLLNDEQDTLMSNIGGSVHILFCMKFIVQRTVASYHYNP